MNLSFTLRRLRAVILLAAFSALAACASVNKPMATQQSVVANETLSLAQAAASSGAYEKAAELFERVLQTNPNDVDALHGAGLAYARMDQNSRAESVLARAADLAPRNVEVRNALGRVHLALTNREAALADFNKGLSLDGRNVSAFTGKAVTLDSMSRHSEAQAVYAKALTYYPANYILRSNYALSLAISGQLDRGIPMLQELISDPSAAEIARGNLALAYGLAGRDGDARTTLMLDMSAADAAENIRIYNGLRRMIQDGKPVGSLVFG